MPRGMGLRTAHDTSHMAHGACQMRVHFDERADREGENEEGEGGDQRQQQVGLLCVGELHGERPRERLAVQRSRLRRACSRQAELRGS